MRKVLLSLAAAVAIGAGVSATGASATPMTPSALQPALVDTNVVDDVRWVRRCWHGYRTSFRRCRAVWVPGYRWRGRHYWRWSRRW
jgi:hypothetical protein